MRRIATIATLTAFLLASASAGAQEFQWSGTYDSERDSVVIYEGQSPQTFVVCVTLLLGADEATLFGDSDMSEITLTVGACAAIEASRIGVQPGQIYDDFRRSEIDAIMFGTFQPLE